MVEKTENEVIRTGVSLPPDVFKQLEEKRGFVSRSAYIREVLKQWWESDQNLNELKGSGESD